MPPRCLGRRCEALNRAGRPCGISSESQVLDGSGRLAAEPLRRGGARCLFHARWFCTTPARAIDLPLLCYLDLETTGLSLSTDEIVEIGAWADAEQAAFSTVVHPKVLPADAGVHGISPEELSAGPSFSVAFSRLASFLEKLTEGALSDDDDSSAEEASELPRLRARQPTVLLAAHNGLRFDFPMLLSQCRRSNVPTAELETWLYVDTIEVLKAAGEAGAGCLKLQCQRSARGLRVDARAHRALDDCIALAAVTRAVAEGLGQQPQELLARFAVKLDGPASAAELSCLL